MSVFYNILIIAQDRCEALHLCIAEPALMYQQGWPGWATAGRIQYLHKLALISRNDVN